MNCHPSRNGNALVAVVASSFSVVSSSDVDDNYGKTTNKSALEKMISSNRRKGNYKNDGLNDMINIHRRRMSFDSTISTLSSGSYYSRNTNRGRSFNKKNFSNHNKIRQFEGTNPNFITQGFDSGLGKPLIQPRRLRTLSMNKNIDGHHDKDGIDENQEEEKEEYEVEENEERSLLPFEAEADDNSSWNSIESDADDISLVSDTNTSLFDLTRHNSMATNHSASNNKFINNHTSAVVLVKEESKTATKIEAVCQSNNNDLSCVFTVRHCNNTRNDDNHHIIDEDNLKKKGVNLNDYNETNNDEDDEDTYSFHEDQLDTVVFGSVVHGNDRRKICPSMSPSQDMSLSLPIRLASNHDRYYFDSDDECKYNDESEDDEENEDDEGSFICPADTGFCGAGDDWSDRNVCNNNKIIVGSERLTLSALLQRNNIYRNYQQPLKRNCDEDDDDSCLAVSDHHCSTDDSKSIMNLKKKRFDKNAIAVTESDLEDEEKDSRLSNMLTRNRIPSQTTRSTEIKSPESQILQSFITASISKTPRMSPSVRSLSLKNTDSNSLSSSMRILDKKSFPFVPLSDDRLSFCKNNKESNIDDHGYNNKTNEQKMKQSRSTNDRKGKGDKDKGGLRKFFKNGVRNVVQKR